MYLAELLERQKDNLKTAVTHGNNSITFFDWFNKAIALSNKIVSHVTKDSTNIALFFPNSINYVIAYFGILFANKVVVPIGTQSKGLEIISTLEYCEIDLVISRLDQKEYLLESFKKYRHKVSILFVDDYSIEIVNEDKDLVLKSGLPKLEYNEDDVAIMLHTSGTTSNPKRVMLTHNNLINNIESNIKSLKLVENDKCLISMPMHFGYCNTAQFLTHLYLGASTVVLDSMFLPKTFFQTIQKYSITNFTGVPSMLLILLDYRYADRYDISSLRYICFGGAKMPIDQLKDLIDRFSTVGFVQTYGQTEASPRCTALLPIDMMRKICSVGKPIPNVKVKIVNSNGVEIFANEIGEIVVYGKNVMKGYYKQEKITNETIIDNWLHTGDLGYLDTDGFLYLTGRKRNMIISGGINIYPEEIEEVLIQYPAVKDACVVSQEHALLGEVPIAKLVLINDISIDIEKLKEYCTAKLTDYKIPVRFDIVSELRKTYNGKIKRF